MEKFIVYVKTVLNMVITMTKKIQDALNLIKIDDQGNWFVPNRKMLNMSISEFIQFERARIAEFNNDDIKSTKYKFHFQGERNND